MRRTVYFVFSALLCVIIILAGCSKSSNTDSTSETNSKTPAGHAQSAKPAENSNTAGTGGSEEMLHKKMDPPVTITTARYIASNMEFKEGEDIADNVFTRWLKSDLGIDLKTLWSVSTAGNSDAYTTKLRLSLSAGQPLPD